MNTNNTIILRAMISKIYSFEEGRAIFVNNEKIFLNDKISSFFDKLEETEAEWEKTSKGIEIEIDDEIKIFPIIERFVNYDGRDHRIVECDFDEMVKWIEGK